MINWQGKIGRRLIAFALTFVLVASVFVCNIPVSFAEEPPAASPTPGPTETAQPGHEETPVETLLPAAGPELDSTHIFAAEPGTAPNISSPPDSPVSAKNLHELIRSDTVHGPETYSGVCATSGDYDYVINTDGTTVTISAYHGAGGDITIPDTLDGMTVTAVGDGSFSDNDSILSVVFPAGVTSIGYEAFYLCESLTDVTFASGLSSIGGFAFEGCGLTSLQIPASVTAIGTDAFGACIDLTEIAVDAANPCYLSESGVLFNKAKTALLQYPAGKPDAAFSIPDGVTVVDIGAFEVCIYITAVTLPGSITEVGEGAFAFCLSLNSANIPGHVKKIQPFTFYKCEALKGIQLANGIESIGMAAFYDCLGLDSILIPSSVTSIGDAAFDASINLTHINFMGDAPAVGKMSFPLTGYCRMYYRGDKLGFNLNWNGYTALSIKPWATDPFTKMGSMGSEGDYDYWVSEGQATIVKYRGSKASVKVPSVLGGCPVTAIGEDAFADNLSVFCVTIPSSVRIVGTNAFARCYNLLRADFQNGTKCIGTLAFSGCTFLRSVNLPASLTTIQSNAFYACNCLTDITIPESVTEIGMYAFFSCRNLSRAYFLGNSPALGYDIYGPMIGTIGVFNTCAPDFKAYYISGKAGYSNPWYGYPTATFDPNSAHTVTFDPSNGQPVIKMTVASGAMVTPPASPSLKGWEFTGWTLSYLNGCWAEFPFRVYNDTTFAAKYTQVTSYLTDVQLSAGALSRSFLPMVYKYKIMLGANEPNVTITPIKHYYGSAYTIDGKAVSSTTVTLANGKSKTITIKVKLGKKSTTYKFTVTRAKSGDNNLAALTTFAGALSQPFDPNVTNYTLSLNHDTKSLTIKAIKANAMAKVSPASKKLTLKNGQTKVIKFTVKAQSGAKKVYTVTVTRAP